MNSENGGSASQSTEPRAIRVLIADDHAIVRKGISALLATEPGIEVVAEACDGAEALVKAKALAPDVILMDLVMPGIDGLEATRRLARREPPARILVLTSFAGDDKIFPAVKAGALGYLLKDSGPEELVEAIRQVNRGESSLHPSVARRLLLELSEPRGSSGGDCLTQRESEVLLLLAQGKSNREISCSLTISEATVRTHVSNILSKLDLGSRTQAALYALREGLVSLDQTESVSPA